MEATILVLQECGGENVGTLVHVYIIHIRFRVQDPVRHSTLSDTKLRFASIPSETSFSGVSTARNVWPLNLKP